MGGTDKDNNRDWTEKRFHNTIAFRSLAFLGALGLAGVSSPVQDNVGSHTLATVHVLSFATWFGTVVYTTFVSGITMFNNLPRQTFGKLQAKLFPQYFALGSITLVLQLITAKGLNKIPRRAWQALGLALAANLVNQFYLEPWTTQTMMRRHDLENKTTGSIETEEYKKVKATFGKLHGMSSLANLVSLCAGVVHGVILGSLVA